MMYLAILFAPPIYFAVRHKWGAFVLNSGLYVLAWLTILFFGIGIVFWALSVGHAFWHLRSEMMQQHAELIASKMAEKLVARQS